MNTVLLTTTFYKSTDELRFKLACQTIQKAVNADYPMVIIDSSRYTEIAEEFVRLGAIVYPQTLDGMGASRRQAFYHALHYLRFELKSQEGIVLWLEPEKYDLIRSIPQIIKPIESGQAKIAIAKRSPESWQTYPDFQQESERKANRAYEEATGRQGFDPMFGVVAFLARILHKHLFFSPERSEINDTYIQHYLPLLEPRENAVSIEIDFKYPPEQKAAEEKDSQIKLKIQSQMEMLSRAYKALAHIVS